MIEVTNLTDFRNDSLRAYYAYLGIHATQQAVEGGSFHEVSYQHPRTIVERLGALSLNTTPIALYDGAEYSARTFVQELAQNGHVLTSLHGISQAHDLMIHILNPWTLVYQEVVDRWSEIAAAYVDADEEQVQSFMSELDVVMSGVSIGNSIRQALHYRHYPETADMYWRETAYDLDLKFKQPDQLYVPISPDFLRAQAHMVVDAAYTAKGPEE